MNELKVDAHHCPPSLNTNAIRSHWRGYHRHKKQWQAELEQLLMVAQLPRHLQRVEATAILRFPDRRRRDSGNFSALLDKALGDALVNGGWLVDDTPDQYRWTNVAFDNDRGERRTRIVLRYE
jgi:hypothetical protein